MKYTAFNFITNTNYSGGNSLLLGNGKYNAFATFNQIRDNGYKVNKGSHGVLISCGFKLVTKTDYKTGKIKSFTVPKHALIFDICDTNALDDSDLVNFIENGERHQSETTVSNNLLTAVMA
jgi:hypothetical protein